MRLHPAPTRYDLFWVLWDALVPPTQSPPLRFRVAAHKGGMGPQTRRYCKRDYRSVNHEMRFAWAGEGFWGGPEKS